MTMPKPMCSGRLRQLLTIGAVLISCLSGFAYKFKVAVVIGVSMQPTLQSGDLLVVDRRAYDRSQPRRGDIVLARYRDGWIIKRVVGLPGEEVELKRGTLFINGARTRENHPIEPGLLSIAKGKLFDEDFATLGDNRAVPPVLAVHPILSKNEIVGKVIFSGSLLRHG
jgi:signal peptidase I